MQFEIYRCGTMFCWRLLGVDGNLLADGVKQRRQRGQIEEDIFQMIDKVPSAKVIDKTADSAPVKPSTEKVTASGKGLRRAHA
jgi:hypothetical protein